MPTSTLTSPIAAQLERDGFAMLPNFLTPSQLAGMQRAFAARLSKQLWNDVDGYEMNERYRHMVPDVLTLDQGFVDAVLNPQLTDGLREYIGPNVQLTEAKGWRSLPTKYDFHGWHGDMWYDQTKVDFIPREVKLAIYLTDVKSGAFKYLKGTQGKEPPRSLKRGEVDNYDLSGQVEVLGPAGSAFVFDTSGIHRQSIPILEDRHAVFFGFHDPSVPLQAEDVNYYRYHPLLLNAAFLGNLTDDDQRFLGFGDKTNYVPHYMRTTSHTGFHSGMTWLYRSKILTSEYRKRIWGKVKRTLRLGS